MTLIKKRMMTRMTIEYTRTILDGVTVDADGDINITVLGGYHGEDVERIFTANDMRVIAARAEAHKAAYQAYIDRDYEDEDKYHSDYEYLAT